MATIFTPEGNKDLVERLQKLTPNSERQWGKMDVAQMLLHCQKPLDVAEGTLLMKRNLFGLLFGKMAKNDFLKRDAFKKNLPTPKEFKIETQPDFEKEKEVLLNAIMRFGRKGPAIIANKKHPFFGYMTDEEWGILQYKHLDHHFKQFAV